MAKQSPEDRLAELLAEVRAAITEAHGVLKDVRTARRSIDTALSRSLAEVEQRFQRAHDTAITELKEWLTAQTAELRGQLDREIDAVPGVVRRVVAEAISGTVVDLPQFGAQINIEVDPTEVKG